MLALLHGLLLLQVPLHHRFLVWVGSVFWQVDTLLFTHLSRLPVLLLLKHLSLGLLHSLFVGLEVLVQHELDQIILLPHRERLLDYVPDPVLLDLLDEPLLLPHYVVSLPIFRCPRLMEGLALSWGHAFQLTEVGLSPLEVGLSSAFLSLPLALMVQLLGLILLYIMGVKEVRNVWLVVRRMTISVVYDYLVSHQ